MVCALVFPAQLDRMSEDEVRDSLWTFALATHQTTFWELVQRGYHHIPVSHAVAAVCMGFLPTAVALRVPSLLLGWLTIPLVVALGRRTGRPEVGLTAGLLLASSPVWWTYAASLSLDTSLAGFTALAAAGTIGRRRLLLLVLALVGAGLTKRWGIYIVGTAVLFAIAGSPRDDRPKSKRSSVALGLLVAIAVLFSARNYLQSGAVPFSGLLRTSDLSMSTWLLAAAVVVALPAAVIASRRATSGRDANIYQLLLFSLPLMIAPFFAARPIPRYFLPALPTLTVLVAAVLWWRSRHHHDVRRRWAAVVAIMVASFGLQTYDLEYHYWPRQRGHRQAASWLAQHVPEDAVIFAPGGSFLLVAAMERGVNTAAIVDVDRTTCGPLEHLLEVTQLGAWVVLPLDRDLGWPGSLDRHAAAMGLELRALVQRDVEPTYYDGAWSGEPVEILGDAGGIPVMAILEATSRPNTQELARPVETVSIPGPRIASEPRPVPGFRDWHHYRLLELEVRADPATLAAARLVLQLRNHELERPLSDLTPEALADGWTRLRLELPPLGSVATSAVSGLGLSNARTGADLEVRALRLVAGRDAANKRGGPR